MSTEHNTRIVDQFTKLATAFATAPQFTDTEALDLLLKVTNASRSDASLDVACGAGVVACHFAHQVSHATGIDITPAMLAKARERQSELGLANVTWTAGDVATLPWEDGFFSIVTSRYAIHHMTSPATVLREMARVCRSGGHVAIADIALADDPADAELFNRIERLNDPSHVRALTEAEWLSAFSQAGLPAPSVHRYKIEFPLARLLRGYDVSSELAASTEAELRQAVQQGRLQGCARIEGDQCVFGYPIAVLSSRR